MTRDERRALRYGHAKFHPSADFSPVQVIPCDRSSSSVRSPTSRTISNLSADVGGQDFVAARPKLIFVTSAAYDGNLKSQGAGSAGLAGADNLYATAAAAAVLGGTWRAWISDGTTAAIDRIQDVGPWVSVAGDGVVFNNKANLATNPLRELRYDENGVDQPGVNVWTGTRTGGHATSPVYDCTDWTSSSQAVPGVFGRNNYLDGNWTNYVGSVNYIYCNGTAHLYCIEQ
jgi:hypothetical protein